VEQLCSRLNLSPSAPLKLLFPSPAHFQSFFPEYEADDLSSIAVTGRDLVARLDVRGLPKKAVVRSLAEYCQDPREAAQMLFISSRPGSGAYNRLAIEEGGFSVMTLLAAFESLTPPVEALAGIVGPLAPRYYSCCRLQKTGVSSGRDFFNFQIVFNGSGVCASWLQSLAPGTQYNSPIIRRSVNQFRLPAEIKTPGCWKRPIVMIAAGTGVSPFLGFLEAIQDGAENSIFTWLIAGFRNRQDDFIFQSEFHEFVRTKTLSQLSLALSRDCEAPKMYVQDVIRRDKVQFYELVDPKQGDALVYICGDEVTMIKGVNEAIVELLMENDTELTKKEAEALLLRWTKERKVIRDIWV
jgi:sulfite reductase alpha subunit-like flavoprotein